MERTDSRLMKDFGDGDDRAFDELVDRYADPIFSFVRHFSGDDNVAEDAAQETFIKVWKNRRRFDPQRDFRPWLFAIARNAALDAARKRKNVAFSHSGDDGSFEEALADESVSFPESFDQKILVKELEETLKCLTPDQRAVVMLHDIEGMTFDEAGRALDKPMNTVKSLYRRAIAILRKRLSDRR